MASPLDIAADRIKLYRENPVAMVVEEFGVKPDPWQLKALQAFPHQPRLAMKACTGPGKTAVLAWIGWNFLLTRPFPVVGCCSITGQNLASNLWPELSRWQAKSEMLKVMFTKTAKRIYANGYEDTWWLEARTWAQKADPEAIGNVLAGLHSDYVMWLLDETGDYPDAVLPACEAIFSGTPKEAHIVQAGNPTRRGGPLFMAYRNLQGMWHVVTITADPDDPERTPRVSKEHALEQIKQYGRENPWVRVKIFGEFPDVDFAALIGEDEVRAAFARYHKEPAGAKIIGVDIADFGDDQSVLFPRQGLQAFPPKRYRHINSIQGASLAARMWAEFPFVGGEADALFLDATGGWGAGWRDQLIQIGRAPIPVNFSASAHAAGTFANKRAEMYWDACEWIKRGGALAESAELLASLTQTNYTVRKAQVLLETKEDVKKKIGYSPDEADAFVLTFAEPVTPKGQSRLVLPRKQEEFNPFKTEYKDDYNPFR